MESEIGAGLLRIKRDSGRLKSLQFVNEEAYTQVIASLPAIADSHIDPTRNTSDDSITISWIAATNEVIKKSGIITKFAADSGYMSAIYTSNSLEEKSLYVEDTAILLKSMCLAIAKVIGNRPGLMSGMNAMRKALYQAADGFETVKRCLGATDSLGKKSFEFVRTIELMPPDDDFLYRLIADKEGPQHYAVNAFGKGNDKTDELIRLVGESVINEKGLFFAKLKKKKV